MGQSETKSTVTRRQFLKYGAESAFLVSASPKDPVPISPLPLNNRPDQPIDNQLVPDMLRREELAVPAGFTEIRWPDNGLGTKYLVGLCDGELRYYSQGSWHSVAKTDDYCFEINPHTHVAEVLATTKTEAGQKVLSWGQMDGKGNFLLRPVGQPGVSPEKASLAYGVFTNEKDEKIPVRAYGLIRTDPEDGSKKAYVGLFDTGSYRFNETEILLLPGINPEDIQLRFAANGKGAICLKFKNTDAFPETQIWTTPFYLTGPDRMIYSTITFNITRPSRGDLAECAFDTSIYPDNKQKGFVWLRVVTHKEAGWSLFWFGPDSDVPQAAADIPNLAASSGSNQEIKDRRLLVSPQTPADGYTLILSRWNHCDIINPPQDRDAQVNTFEFADQSYASIVDPSLTQAAVYKGNYTGPDPIFAIEAGAGISLPPTTKETQVHQEINGDVMLSYTYLNNDGNLMAVRVPLKRMNQINTPMVISG